MEAELNLDLPSLVSLSFGSCSFYFCYSMEIKSRIVFHCIIGRLSSITDAILLLKCICELQWKARESVSSIPTSLAVSSLWQRSILELSDC